MRNRAFLSESRTGWLDSSWAFVGHFLGLVGHFSRLVGLLLGFVGHFEEFVGHLLVDGTTHGFCWIHRL